MSARKLTGPVPFAGDAALEAISQGRQSPRDALNGAAERMKVK
jgi:hypothetical protein